MGRKVITKTADPLDGQRPAISLTVDPHIPASRTLSLQGAWFSSWVQGPPNALSHIFYSYTVGCGDGWTGNFVWQDVSDGVILPERWIVKECSEDVFIETIKASFNPCPYNATASFRFHRIHTDCRKFKRSRQPFSRR